jgi:hypothetical protein
MVMAAKVEPQQLCEVIDRAEAKTDGESVRVGDLVKVYRRWSYGPLLMIVALVSLFPLIGGLPFVTMITGALVILIAAQMPFRKYPLMPNWLINLSLPRDKFVRFLHWARPRSAWLDRLVHPRLVFLTEKPWLYLVALQIVFLGLLFFPLDYIPFAVAGPASVVLVSALGLTVRDGVMILLGFVLTALPVGLVIWLWPF